MAYTPRKNMFGRAYGLKRGPNPRLYATNGIEARGLFLSTSVDTAGAMTQVNIEDWTTVTASATGTVALAARGVTAIAGGASSLYTLVAPQATGIRRTFFTTSTSTAVRQITSASNIIVGASVGGDSGTLTASTAMTVMTFNGLGQTIELVSLSTSAWVNVSLRGFSTGATPLSS